MHTTLRVLVRSLLILVFAISANAAPAIKPTGGSVPREVLIKIRKGASQAALANLEQIADAEESERVASFASGTVMRFRSRSKNVEALAAALEKNPNIEYVEPNYVLRLVATPNDTSFGLLWGLKNTGQSIGGSPGFPGSHINAEAAWNVTTGSASIVVGVVDTGVDYNHPDLAANIWNNPGGKGNVTCAAGTHGFNAITKTCDPHDNHYHGTHVSGTIGGVGNNSLGVAGVNWTTSIMGLKFLDADGYGTTANAIAAIDFAVQAKIDGVNVRVLSNSWGGGYFSKSLLDAINKANEHDILFVASAGNDSSNNDFYPKYPANYATPNMISVAATTNTDGIAYFSSYGPTTVHLGAPGVDVYSTFPGASYGYLSGTSMAAPHVAGVAALILASTPALTTAEVKSEILDNTDPLSSLSGKTITGGRLNAAKAIGAPLGPDFSITTSPSTRTVVRGNSTTYTITITPSAGFTGSVALSVSGLPSGSSSSFSPSSATTTSTLTLNIGASSPTGNYPLVISGIADGIAHATVANVSVVTTAPVVGCPSFNARIDYSAAGAAALAAGDFNRDGIVDLAVANVTGKTVATLRGNGTSFLSAVYHEVGTAPIAVTTSDFNGDGKTDIAVANSGSNDVSILLGTGDGAFQSAVHYSAGVSPFSVAAGDFDGDGKIDLAVANNGSSNVSILKGAGDGTFQSAVNYGTGSGPFWVAIGDFDSDGRNDLAVANYNAGKVSILPGNGDGTFGAAVDLTVGGAPSSVAIGDFNADGALDLAVSNYTSNNIGVLTGNGDGTFDAAVNYATGTGPYSVSAGDIDGDGKLDLVTASSSGPVSLLRGNTNGTFAAATQYVAGTNPNQAIIADLNRDGKADIAVANPTSANVSVLFNSSVCALNCGTWAAAVDYAAGTTPDALAAADFNGDGRIDLAIADKSANDVSVKLGNGDGTFTAGGNYAAGDDPDALIAGDFNGDGTVDLAVANNGSGNVSILIGNGDGSFQTAANYGAGTNPRSVAAGDVNGDGRLDLVVANGGSNNVSVLLGNGNGTFQAAVNYAVGTNPSAVATADLNRDGRADIAAANTGSNNVSILLGNGNGTFQTATITAAGTSPSSIAAGDFNRDGKLDLAVSNGGSNDVSVLRGNANGTFQAALNYAVGTAPSMLVASDVDADGSLDLAVTNNGSNNVSVLFNTGTGVFESAVHSSAGNGPAALVAAHFNRDGKPDLAIANSTAASVSILLNTCPLSDMTVTKTHTGNFVQGDAARTYTITATNSGGAPTEGVVSVKDTLPAGLTATALSGTGWSCSAATLLCTRTDSLAPGASYPAITLTVKVASSAPASVTNTATVAGGGELDALNNTASDQTTVEPVTDLTITATHSGNFAQGDTGRTYKLLVRNAGGLATAGLVTVVDTLPAGLTATAIAGTGWNCTLGNLTCTRSDALAANTAYPAITLTVNVAANAPTSVTNVAAVTGGGDGVATNNTASDLTVIWNSQNCGSFGISVQYDTGDNPQDLAMGNFNGDAYADLVVANYYADNVSIYLGNGDGTFATASKYAVGDAPIAVATGDLTNDGISDLVILNQYSGSVSVLLGNGNGTFAARVQYPVSDYVNSVALGDFDGDGDLDVAATEGAYQGVVHILLGNGNGTLQTAAEYPAGQYPQSLTVADFDGNGRLDLVVSSEYGGLWVLLGNGNGTFQSAVQYASGNSTYWVSAGDFNRDGNVDLVAGSYYSGTAFVSLGNGNGTFQAPVIFQVSYGSFSATVEDLNGDGKADLVIVNGSSNRVVILLGNGDGTFQPEMSYSVGNGLTALVIGDFNADGRPDLAVTTAHNDKLIVMSGGCPDLTIAKSHAGNFKRGQTNAKYTLNVANIAAGGTLGQVTVTDVLPAGLTATAMSGSGWSCTLATLTCTRSDTLGSGSYPDISLFVTVSETAPASVTNTATVSGGADAVTSNNSASDPTTIVQGADLTITKTRLGPLARGQQGATYYINVGNSGAAPSSGTVTVTDAVPTGITPIALTGSGWNCDLAAVTCSRTDSLAVNQTYPVIILNVNVSVNAPATLTNTANVSGGGDVVPSNNSATDVANVLFTPTNLIATAATSSSVALTWTAIPNAPGYDILRSSNGGPLVLVKTVGGNSTTDTGLVPYTTYTYRVRVSVAPLPELSSPDLATTVIFTDDPLGPGTGMKAVHVNELRGAVNAMRAAAGLAAQTFTDSVTIGGPFKALHITELRSSLNAARTALGLPAIAFTDPALTAGTTMVKAAHVSELRNGVK